MLLILSGVIYSQHERLPIDMEIWNDFVQTLKDGKITRDKIKPYFESLREPMFQFLSKFQKSAVWEEWEKPKEIKRVGLKSHYIIPLAFGEDDTSTFIFSFIIEDKEWYFHHVENVIIRLDTLITLPASEFPTIPNQLMQWILEEERWSYYVKMFNILSAEKGKDFALNSFKDGIGYFLQAKTWVPLVEPEKAFILFLCWDLSIRRGCHLTLEKLEPNEALIRFTSQFLKLYRITAHLRSQISFDDYQSIFETIWHDRAEKAGWDLTIEYDGDRVEFQLFKK